MKTATVLVKTQTKHYKFTINYNKLKKNCKNYQNQKINPQPPEIFKAQ